MATWQTFVDDDFDRPVTAVLGAQDQPSSPGFGPGNFWEDHEGIYQIVEDPIAGRQLLANVIVVSTHYTQYVVRPSVENTVNHKIVLETGPNTVTNNDWIVFVKWQDMNNFYYARMTTGTGVMSIVRRLAGVETTLGTKSWGGSTAYVPGTDYRFELQATTTGGTTTLVSALYDNGTSTLLATDTRTDSSAALQGSGRCGVYAHYFTTASNPHFSRLATFYDATESMTVDPVAFSTHLSVLQGDQTVNVTGIGTSWTPGSTNTFSILGGATIVSQLVSDATHAQIVVSAGTSPKSMVLVASSGARAYLPVILPTISASPVLVKNTTGNTVNLEGFGTLWTESDPTFSIVSGGTGAAITNTTILTDNTATLTMNAGSAGDVLTLADDSTDVEFTVDVGSYLAVSDSKFFLSPYTWYKSGSSYAQTQHPGAYILAEFTGRSITLTVDVSPLVDAGVAAANYPTLRWSVDNAPWTDLRLSSTSDVITLAGGLAAGTHTLTLYYLKSVTGTDRWVTPVNVVRVETLFTNGEWSAPDTRPKRLLVYWDSIGQGYFATMTGGTLLQESTASPIPAIAVGMDAEVGAVVVNGQGLAKGGDGGVPALYGTDSAHRAWDKYDANHSRLVSGLLSPAPDYILCLHGTNDGLSALADSTVVTAVVGWLASVRSAAPNAYIFLAIPVGQFKASAITEGYNTYIAAHDDSKAHLIDLGTALAQGMTGFVTGGTATSIDGVHPRDFQNARVAAALIKAMQGVLAVDVVSSETHHIVQRTSARILDFAG